MSSSTVPGKAASILQLMCPRCRKSKLFHTPTFSFSRPFDMKDRCDVCDLDFMPEPGYYYGAMYVSYMFAGGFSLLFIGVLHWGFGWGLKSAFALLLGIFAFLMVYVFRLSRSFWLGIHYKYREDAADMKEK